MKRNYFSIFFALSLSLLGLVALVGALTFNTAAVAAAGSIIRVTATGNPVANGDSWANATTLQNGLAIAANGDEIWVASGVYTPGLNVDDSFNLPPGVQLYGGFGGAETARSQRNWEANLTILSGDIDGDDTTDVNGVVTSTVGIVGSNSYHVLFLDGRTGTPITETTAVDGFVITAGYSGGSYNSGGGLYCDGSSSGSECSPTLSNLIFSGNRAARGGALVNNGYTNGRSNPIMTNILFSGNLATDRGGAIYNNGFNNGDSSPTLTHVIFVGNQAVNHGGAVYNDGLSGQSNPVLVNVALYGNQAGEDGGGMTNDGRVGGVSEASLTNVTIAGNRAFYGGGLFNVDASPVLTNVILWGNQADQGYQLFNNDATPSLSYTLIQSGTNDIHNHNASSVSYGAGILTSDPLFTAPVAAALAPTTAGNYHLQIESPAINAGSNAAVPSGVTTDLDGKPRIIQGTVDMGAYEFPSVCASGDIIFVDKNASGDNDGSSWGNAFTQLQTPLNLLSGPCEIWVASGVYTPGLSVDDSFNVASGVQLYGGFNGTEAAHNQRDWQANLTILSGDIDGDDLTDANGVVTDTANINGGNSHHVLRLDGTGTPITETTVIDGFAITAGQANGIAPDNIGGGLFCNGQGAGGECSPTLANLVFAGNWAEFGGALYNSGSNNGASSPDLTNVRFIGNRADASGGAVVNNGQNSGVSSPALRNVAFTGNAAGLNGGAMFNQGVGGASSPNLVNALFSGNQANFGGAIYNNGQSGGASSPSLINVTLAHNRANFWGGAMYSTGQTGGGSSPALINSVVWGNQADNNQGHQLFNNDATPSLSHTLIQSGTNDIHNAGSSSVSYGAGILTGDPLFAAPVAPLAAPTAAGDYRLLVDSPAIDAGDNGSVPFGVSADLDGNFRFFNGATDMGAYESGDKLCGISWGNLYTLNFAAPVQIFVLFEGDIDCLQVVHTDQDHPNATSGIQTGRYWQITAVNNLNNPASSFNVILILPTSFTPDANDKACRYVGPGDLWDCAADSYDSLNNTVSRDNVTDFSDWAVGNDVGPTAVTLLNVAVKSGNPFGVLIALLALAVGGISAAAFRWRRELSA